MTKRICWKKGMRLTDDILRASGNCTVELVGNALALAAAGRFGLFPSTSPFELSLNISNGIVDVELLNCLAVTKSGSLIDVHYDTKFTNSFDTRVQIPEGSGDKEFILTINADSEQWKEVNDGYEEPIYSFSLVTPNNPLPATSLPIARIVDEYGVIYSHDGLHLLKCNSSISHYQVRPGCKVIRDWAFAFYHGSSISIPNTVTHIGSYAFTECKNITNITIPTSIIHIGAYAFAFTNIESVICESSSFSYENGCLIDVRQKKVLAYLSTESNVTIPSYITCIDDGAFMNTISRITLNNGLTSIGEYAFSHCIGLREITFPYSLKNIGYGAFSGTNIKNVINLSPDIIYENDCLINKESKALVACFSNENKIELPKGITHIGSSAFNKNKYNYNPRTIIVPEGVTTIEDRAFVNCNNLRNITLPKTLKYIGSKAFDLCFELARIKLPKGLEYIGWDAFPCYGSHSFIISIPNGTREHFEALLPDYQHDKIKEQLSRKKP